MKYFSCNGAGSQSNRWVGQDLQDALPATKLSRLNMCQPANQTSDLSAGTELTPYVTQVGQHMFPMKSENVTATYHTFGGVQETCFQVFRAHGYRWEHDEEKILWTQESAYRTTWKY